MGCGYDQVAKWWGTIMNCSILGTRRNNEAISMYKNVRLDYSFNISWKVAMVRDTDTFVF